MNNCVFNCIHVYVNITHEHVYQDMNNWSIISFGTDLIVQLQATIFSWHLSIVSHSIDNLKRKT